MSDVLSAASLVLAVLAVVLGMWYPSIEFVLALRPEVHAEDNRVKFRKISSALYQRALPLLGASAGCAILFVPDIIHIVYGSFMNVRDNGWMVAISDYDSCQGAFLLVYTLSMMMLAHLVKSTRDLVHHRRSFRHSV